MDNILIKHIALWDFDKKGEFTSVNMDAEVKGIGEIRTILNLSDDLKERIMAEAILQLKQRLGIEDE